MHDSQGPLTAGAVDAAARGATTYWERLTTATVTYPDTYSHTRTHTRTRTQGKMIAHPGTFLFQSVA